MEARTSIVDFLGGQLADIAIGARQPRHGGLAAGKPDEDQAELGNRKVKNIGHAGKVFSSAFSGGWRLIRQPDLRANSTFCP